ncbi:hypothetical protein [Aurantimonas sp. VKM B-3413]|uniref:hypothetical protein n=1 Tax=Aurantimonas sp. VKM B-3413 TaxID=2779401 RepID=UPI001E370F1D|nr:hypothetical protein [Aurantimonas sp. VKM B-3413]MCB8839442.1 hypothetical protein [Aurantimonas sp. VKM B-3413]
MARTNSVDYRLFPHCTFGTVIEISRTKVANQVDRAVLLALVQTFKMPDLLAMADTFRDIAGLAAGISAWRCDAREPP